MTLFLILIPLFFLSCCCGVAACCGVTCEELPDPLYVTVEFISHLTGDPCGECDASDVDVVQLIKDCGTETPIYAQSPNDVEVCDTDGEFPESPLVVLLSNMVLRCTSVSNVCGDPVDPLPAGEPFALDMSTLNGDPEELHPDPETACCDPLYLEYVADLGCNDGFMMSGTARYRIIITE